MVKICLYETVRDPARVFLKFVNARPYSTDIIYVIYNNSIRSSCDPLVHVISLGKEKVCEV